jgi:hypothetical protein
MIWFWICLYLVIWICYVLDLYLDLLLFFILDLKYALKPAKKWPKPVQNQPNTHIEQLLQSLVIYSITASSA